jgi:hypothetical protein
VAARLPRGGDGRSVLRDHLEYARAHCVRWFVAVDPNHAAVACPCGVPERRVVGCRTLDELRDECFVGRAAVEVSIDCEPAASATVVTARTAATRSWYRRCVSESLRQPPCGRTLTGRGAPPSGKTRGTSPRGPAEPPTAVPGNRLRLSQRAFSGTRAQCRYWADNSSKQAGAWIFGDFASMTRRTTWVMEMRFVTRCTTTTSLR